MKPYRVVWVGGEPTPYREPHLAALAAADELDLHVVYPARTIQRRAWSTPASGARTSYLRGPMLPLARVLHHDYPLTPQVVGLLERERPDCVVVSGWALLAAQLAIAWCRARRTPYLLASDSHADEPRAAWVEGVKRVVLPPLVGRAAGWLVPGRLARDYVIRYGADQRRIVVFPLTVDIDRLARRADELRSERDEARARFGAGADDILVLQVGRLVPFKAADRLIEATAAAGRASDARLRLVLAGAGPMQDALRSLADRVGASVAFPGQLEGDELVRAYVAADVFVLASRREPWGVVVNEAMACGLPLVLSDRVGAAADLLVPGENGEVVPADDVGALARALAALASDPRRRRRYGAASRRLIAPWGYQSSVDDVASLVAEVVSDARRSPRTTRSARP